MTKFYIRKIYNIVYEILFIFNNYKNKNMSNCSQM